MEEKKDLINIGGLWKTISEKGKGFLSGRIYCQIAIFPNKYKTPNDEKPDFNICISKAPRKEKKNEDN